MPPSVALPDVRRDEYRLSVGELLEDMLVGAATGGNATTIFDTANLIHVDNWWAYGWASLTVGTGAPATRRISASSQSGMSVTLTPALLIAPDITTTYELHKLWSKAKKDEAINHAIRSAYPRFKYQRTDTSLTTASQTYQYLLPADCDRIVKIEMQRIPSVASYPYLEILGCDVVVVGNARYLQTPRQLPIGRTLRITYEARWDTLQTDDDTAKVPREYVRFKAAAYLCKTVPISGDADRQAYLALGKEYGAEAEQILKHYVQRPEAGRVISPADTAYDGVSGSMETLAAFHSP